MLKSKKYLTASAKQTFNLGKKLAKKLKGGEIVTLTGELGAGKTVFAKGIASGLGVKKTISSPTFTLINVYELRAKSYKLKAKQLIHIDCYRLTNAGQLKDIGATEYFGQADTIVVIEWPEKIKSILPRQKIKITLKLKSQNNRMILIK